MKSIAEKGQLHAPLGVALRRSHAEYLVGPIVNERHPTLEVASTSTYLEEASSSERLDVCRLLVALFGLSLYLVVPAVLFVYVVSEIAG